MPITEELKTAQELRAAGAAPALAELLAAKLEGVAVATRDAAFRDILVEIKALRGDMNAELKALRSDMDVRFAEMKAGFETSLRIWMAAWIAALGVAVANIKLFPNWH